MQPPSRTARRRTLRVATLVAPAAAALFFASQAATANVALTQVSHDIYTDAQAQHNTEVEPDTFAFGSTIVAAFQVGRVSGGGASNIGWATSTDGGATWSHGYLPGITGNAGGSFGQVSDASVAYDARHNVWLISTIGINGSSVVVLTSRSTDGGLTWGNPVTTATGDNDKNWIVCDDTATSPHYGNCYTEYDIAGSGDSLRMRTSTDGGATWGAALAPSGLQRAGLGGQPVVLANGDVIVPYLSLADTIRFFRSTNGGTSWGSTALIASVSHHTVAGGLREEALPSAEVDGAGTVYVAWADSRFRSGGSSNDIVVAKSTSETTWAAPVRVPIDTTSSTVDHFIPGIGVDRSTSGATARVGLTYYFYPTSSCTAATCQLEAGFISSVNGGASWSAPTQLAGPMSLSWIPNTSQGRMFGDYISTSVLAGGNAYPVLPVANAPTGSTFDLAMYAPTGGLPITGGGNTITRTAAAPAAPATAGVRSSTAN
ncbi:MAG: exo-alpha-sialidase [Micromonosporaceae bacterium]|nr:exo-alpha-sialidase [Micromonosporaceae bacterium]